MSKKLVQQEFPEFADGRSILLPDGSEVPDPRPMELPVGFEKPESLQSMIKRFVTDRLIKEELEASDIESFDEADDFEDDDGMPASPHEDTFDPLHLLAREQEIRSGTVRDRTPEEKLAAKQLIEKHLTKQSLDGKKDGKDSTST